VGGRRVLSGNGTRRRLFSPRGWRFGAPCRGRNKARRPATPFPATHRRNVCGSGADRRACARRRKRKRDNAAVPAYPEPRTFLDEVLVECPRCREQAIVGAAAQAPRMTCGHCGYIVESAAETPRLTWSSVRQDGREPAFELRLWLTTECCGGKVLWALNEPHLDYLERFVASKHRDRDFPSPSGNRGLSYKLPRWMQAARNRDELLRAMSHLRQRLA
jgi:ribosomal protein S27AE